MEEEVQPVARTRTRRFSLKLMYRQRYLMLMSIPFVIWLIIFKYVPLWGWTMAFQEVRSATFALPFLEREFVGLQNFKNAFSDYMFIPTLRNTLALSFLSIFLGTVSAVALALVLNEVRFNRFKRLTQTISYLPHFVSWVIIASIAKMLLNDGGTLDTMTSQRLGLMSTNSPQIWVVITLVNIWKEMGWDAIIYLSAMAGIDQGLYEAAKVDGAGRFQRMWNITLPGIRPTLIVIIVMSIGGVLNIGMERQMLLSNALVQDHTMVFSWFAYVRGIGSNNYGLGTAIGMFQSLVGIILLVAANRAAKLMGETSLI